MRIMLQKDAATQIHKDVADLDEAVGIAGNGFHVSVEQEDGTFKALDEVLADQTPADADAEPKPAAKKPAAKKK